LKEEGTELLSSRKHSDYLGRMESRFEVEQG